MKNVFAMTSNVQRFLGAMHELKKRGATEASWVLLTGVPGLELDSETAARLKKLQPGGFILFGRNIKTPEQLRKLCDDLRDISEVEPFTAG